MKRKGIPHVLIQVGWKEEDWIRCFYPLLQKGVFVTVSQGMTLETFLTRSLGLSDNDVDKRLGTIFVNGIPVDEPRSLFLRDNDTVALSGPMPGLAGAIMRKGSPLAPLRHNTKGLKPTELKERRQRKCLGRRFRIKVKLFNTALVPVAGKVLALGPDLPGSALAEILTLLVEKRPEMNLRVWVDGDILTPKEWMARLGSVGDVSCQIHKGSNLPSLGR